MSMSTLSLILVSYVVIARWRLLDANEKRMNRAKGTSKSQSHVPRSAPHTMLLPVTQIFNAHVVLVAGILVIPCALLTFGGRAVDGVDGRQPRDGELARARSDKVTVLLVQALNVQMILLFSAKYCANAKTLDVNAFPFL